MVLRKPGVVQFLSSEFPPFCSTIMPEGSWYERARNMSMVARFINPVGVRRLNYTYFTGVHAFVSKT